MVEGEKPEATAPRRSGRKWGVAAIAVLALGAVLGGALLLRGLDEDRAAPPVSTPATPPGTAPDPPPNFETEPERPPRDLTEVYTWEPVAIGGGGWVTGFVSHPETADLHYARTDVGGLYRWDPAGERWVQLLHGERVPEPEQFPSDWDVESVAVGRSDPDRVYAAVGSSIDRKTGRVLRSDDQGLNWSDGGGRFVIAGNAQHRLGSERLAVDPFDADIVWFGTRVEGLQLSEDGARTWRTVEGVPTGENDGDPAGVKWVLVDPTAPLAGGRASRLFVGVAGEGVFRTDDAGVTWQRVIPLDGVPVAVDLGADGRLWVTTRGPGSAVAYDVSTGAIIDVRPAGERDYGPIAVDPRDPNRVVLGETGVRTGSAWHSTDGGSSWTAPTVDTTCPEIEWLDDVGPAWLGSGALRFDPLVPDQMWFAEGFAVWQLQDPFADDWLFRCRTEGIEELVMNSVVVPPGGHPTTASWDRALIHHVPDRPRGPIQGPTPRFNSAWDLDWSPADPSVLVAIVSDHRFCCEDGQHELSGYSTDGGATWVPFASYDNGAHPSALRFGNIAIAADDVDNLVWLPTWNQALHVSRDRGATWREVILPGSEDLRGEDGSYQGGSHFQYYLGRRVLTADRVAPQTFYLYHQELGLFRSTDGGESWEQRGSEGLPVGWTVGWFNARLVAVPDSPGELLFTPGGLEESVHPVYRSTDAGDTWEPLAGTGAVSAIGFGAPMTDGGPPTAFFAGRFGGDLGVWRSSDGFETYERIAVWPNGYYRGVKALAGDPDEPGTVYVAFSGVSLVVGRDASAGEDDRVQSTPGQEP
jgi:hypothetical protein